MTVEINAMQGLLDLQKRTEEIVKEAGEALQVFIAKNMEIRENLSKIGSFGSASDGSVTKHKPVHKAAPKAAVKPSKDTNGEVKRRGKKNEFENKSSLKEVILEILSRAKYKNGISVKEMAEIISQEKVWQTSGNLISQISTNLYTLAKKDKKAQKGEDGLYSLA